MKKSLIISILLALVAGNMCAADIVTDIISLTDGTICEGYIRSQRPGKELQIYAKRTVKSVPCSSVAARTDKTAQVSSLPESWREWIDEHPSVAVSRDGKQTVTLSSFTVRAQETDTVKAVDSCAVKAKEPIQITDAIIIEEGSAIRYVDFSEGTFTVKRNNIKSVRSTESNPDLLSGFTDEVELRSGTVISGKIIENILGEKLRIKTSSGVIKSCDADEVLVSRKIKMNESQSYVEQSPILEVVTLNNGRNVEGLVVEQHYAGTKQSSSIVFVDKDQKTSTFLNSDIKELSRKKNDAYHPLYALHIGADELYANSKPIEKTTLLIDKKRLKISAVKVNSVEIDRAKPLLTLQMQKDRQNERIVVFPVTETEKDQTYTIDIASIIDISIPLNEKTEADGIVYWRFPVSEGQYAIYLPSSSTAYLCRCKYKE